MKLRPCCIAALLLVATSLLFGQRAIAQSSMLNFPALPDPQPDGLSYSDMKVRVVPDTFPFIGFISWGGYDFGPRDTRSVEIYKSNRLKELGLNAAYDAGGQGAGDVAQYMQGGLGAYPWFDNIQHGPDGDAENDLPIMRYTGTAVGALANEYRYFLAANEDLYLDQATKGESDQFGFSFAQTYDFEAWHMKNPFGKTFDETYDRNWWQVMPAKAGIDKNGEFHIPQTPIPDQTAYLLRNLGYYDETLQPFGPNHNGDLAQNWKLATLLPDTWQANTGVSCDFVYRLDLGELPNVDPNAVLFDVEFTLFKVAYVGNEWITTPITVSYPITLGVQNTSEGYLGYTSGPHRTESYNILHFPKQDAHATMKPHTTHDYAIIHADFSMHEGQWSNSLDLANPDNSMFAYVRLDCRLKAHSGPNGSTYPIYVRGIRLRSGLAQRTLTGQDDNYLKSLFRHKRTLLQSRIDAATGKTAWDNTRGFAIGQEIHNSSQRMYAYLDALCYKTVGKHFQPYLVDHGYGTKAQSLREAAEDQNISVTAGLVTSGLPVAFQSENAFGMPGAPGPDLRAGSGWRVRFYRGQDGSQIGGLLPIPKDALPFELRHMRSLDNSKEIFSMYGVPVTGSDNLRDPLDNSQNVESNIGYSDYTNAFQEWLKTMPGLEAALTACPQYLPSTRWTRWYATAPVNAIVQAGRDLAPMSNYFDPHLSTEGRAKAASTMECGGGVFPGDEVYKDYNQQVHDNLVGPDPWHTGSWPGVWSRPSTAQEIRATVWSQICAGAKGVAFNSIGSDRGGDIGILFDNSDRIDYDVSRTKAFITNAAVNDCGHQFLEHITPATANNASATLRDHVIVRNGDWGYYSWQTAPFLDGNNNYIDDADLPAYLSQLPDWQQPTDHWSSVLNEHCSSLPGIIATTSDGKTTSWNSSVIHSASLDFKEVGPDKVDATGHVVYVTDPQQGGGDWPTYAMKVLSVDPADPHAITVSGNLSHFEGDVNASGFKLRIGGIYDPSDFRDHCSSLNKEELSCNGVAQSRPVWLVRRFPDWLPWGDVSLPTYYGFKNKWDGSKRVIDDLSPIALTLSRLDWKFTTDYANAVDPNPITDDQMHFHSINAALVAKLPIEITASRYFDAFDPAQLADAQHPANNPEPGRLPGDTYSPEDNQARMLYQFGVFSSPAEPDATYFTVVNRRSWPYRYSNDGSILRSDNGEALQGNVDRRRLEFTLRRDIIDPQSKALWYNVMNMRTGKETVLYYAYLTSTSLYVDLDPGEGTLFRIAPVHGTELGLCARDGMEWNNGHRVADLPNDKRVVAWQSVMSINDPEPVGHIKYALTDAPSGVSTALATTMQVLEDAVVNPNHRAAFNPSVATKDGGATGKDTIAIIYSLERDPLLNASQKVILYVAVVDRNNNNQQESSVFIPLDPGVVASNPNFTVAPTVSWSQDGFFCCWPTSAGIHRCFVYNTSKTSNILSYSRYDMLPDLTSGESPSANANWQMDQFPSIADEDEATSAVSYSTERFHLAYQENYTDGTSQIYYWSIEKTLPQYQSKDWDFITSSVRKARLSKGAPSCLNIHPNIALIPLFDSYPNPNQPPLSYRDEPAVTWECHLTQGGCLDGINFQPAGTSYSLLRSMELSPTSPAWPVWGSLKAFLPRVNNQPLPLAQWKNGICLLMQDSLADQIRFFSSMGSFG